LVKALGMTGISRSQVSRLCQALDEQVERFRSRPLAGAYPDVWTDATFVKVRQDGRVVSSAVVIAVGVHDSGQLADLMDAAEVDVLAYLGVPRALAPAVVY
jgi:transposase-like protein